MKMRLYLVLAVCFVVLSGSFNNAFAMQAYTDYSVTNEATLDSALTDTDANSKRIEINSNINLQNNLSHPICDDLIMNGNTKTIDGGAKAGLNTPPSFYGTINDLTLTNFKAPISYSPAYGVDTSFGGAILHQQGNLEIFNSQFTNNVTEGGFAAIGGAIANINTNGGSAGTVNIYNSSFINNKAGMTVQGRGGAIYNIGTMNIYSSEFTRNIANSANSNSVGGAIQNEDTLNIYNSTFGSDNIADANKSYNGGAVSNWGDLTIYNSTFKNNMATNSGGAIYNLNPPIKVYDSVFIGNSAQKGGAIYNAGTAYIIADKNDVKFTGNTATGNGGAIYNNGNLYLIANNGGITFTGNTATGLGNDIYNNLGGFLYLNSGIGDITFNGGIYSNMGGISINDPSVTYDGLNAPSTGRIILNSPLTASPGTGITVNGGTLKVGTAGSIGASGAGNAIGSLTLSGNSVLNLADGTIKQNNIYVDSLTTSSNTSSIWMDANLSLGTNAEDTINVGNYHMAAKPNFVLRILGDDTNPAAMGVIAPLTGAGDYFDATVKAMAYTNHYKYDFTGNTSNFFGFLDYDRTGDGATYDGLKGALTDASAFRSFSLVGDYTAGDNLDSNAITNTLTIFGTGKSGFAISGDNQYRLFNVASGGTLNIVDAVIKDAKFRNFNYYAAINNNGTLNVYDSFITGNNSVEDGSAIHNNGNAYISGSTFTKNSTDNYGGAISNTYGNTLSIYNSVFGGSALDANTANTGGAIDNEGTAYISDSIFSYNKSYGSRGGAIYNQGTLSIYNSLFNNNSNGSEGGAIANDSKLSVYNSTFKNNNNDYFGGAIYSRDSATSSIYNSTFGGSVSEGNTAKNGGAICLEGGFLGSPTVNLIASGGNMTFSNNSATDTGGAICLKTGTLNLIANNGNITFTGNTATNGGNDIYLGQNSYRMGNSNLNLNSAQGSKISFDGGIKSSAIANGTININKTGTITLDGQDVNLPKTGEVVLNAPIETSTVNLYGGTLTLGHDNYLDGNALTLNGGTLNMQNNATGAMLLDSLAVNGTTNVKIDVDLANAKSDTINSSSVSAGTGILKVSSIKLLSDSVGTITTTNLTNDAELASNIRLGVTKAYTPIYQYGITYDGNGNLVFAGDGSGGGGGGFNPAILNAPVSANVGAYMSQVSVYNEALGRAELFMSLPQQERLLMKQRNMYANVGGNDVQPEVFSPTFLPDEKGGVWFKQYTWFENVPLNNGPNVSNVGYGVMVGADSPMYHLKNGYDGYLTTYVAYNGSHQNYDAVGVNQNGGALGVTGTLYKGNFFTALTASVGDNYGQANTMYGVDNFNTLLAGLAWKTGYNIEMAQGKYILQPSLLAAYTFANTFDYTTASGVNMTSDPMNAVQIAPGAKFIYNAKDGWQPYLAANMVFNIMDTQKFYANTANLPQMSIDPYFEYGVGVQRRWGERFTGFGQAMLRGGGRNGIAMQFGFRIAIGK